MLKKAKKSKLSVDAAQKWINTVLLKDITPEERAKYHISAQGVCRTTAHTWMTRCGASAGFHKKGYYNDMHERRDVVEYRRDVYLPACAEIERREPLWVHLAADELATVLDGVATKMTPESKAGLDRLRSELLCTSGELEPAASVAATHVVPPIAQRLSDLIADNALDGMPSLDDACTDSDSDNGEDDDDGISQGDSQPDDPSTALVQDLPSAATEVGLGAPQSQPIVATAEPSPDAHAASTQSPVITPATVEPSPDEPAASAPRADEAVSSWPRNVIAALLRPLTNKQLTGIVGDIQDAITKINRTQTDQIRRPSKLGNKATLVTAIMDNLHFLDSDYFQLKWGDELEVAQQIHAASEREVWVLRDMPPKAAKKKKPDDDDVSATQIHELIMASVVQGPDSISANRLGAYFDLQPDCMYAGETAAPVPEVPESESTYQLLAALVRRVGADDAPMFEVHVDLLGDAALRNSIPMGGNVSIEAGVGVRREDCSHNAHGSNCKCHLPVYRIGQDESCYKQNALSARVWYIDNIGQLRKKSDGAGLMVSAFVDEIRGFGFPMTSDQLLQVNQYRETRGRTALETSPGLRLLDYGANRDGYWTNEKFLEQCQDIIDCIHVLYPNHQVRIAMQEFDERNLWKAYGK